VEILIQIEKFDLGGRKDLKTIVSVYALCMSGVKTTDPSAMRCISCEHELYGMLSGLLTSQSMIHTTKLVITSMLFSKLLRLCRYICIIFLCCISRMSYGFTLKCYQNIFLSRGNKLDGQKCRAHV
jgi:hypothetical protein